jgi:hypothetical protein
MPTHSIIQISLRHCLPSIAVVSRIAFVLGLAAASLIPLSARAETILLMIEEPGCVWCARWNQDVGGEYPITPEGRAAPLVRAQIRDGAPEGITLASRPRFTPTFIVVTNGTEVGRIEGYPGEDFFWGLLGRILERATPNG